MTASQGYVAISRRALDLEDYIDIVRRHAGWIAGPLYVGIVISVCVAFSLKNTYESQAMMQIIPAQISDDLVKNTVNQQLSERIVSMESNIMSRTSLSNIIQDPRLKLYPDEMANQTLEDVIELMRRNIVISINSIPQERKGSPTFSIRFSYPDRLKAQATVQVLMSKFEEQNTVEQRQQQTVLTNFFGDELTTAKAALEKRNEELTKFRNENQGRLPENSLMNMQSLTSLQTQVNGINDQLNRLQQERVTLETHLSSLKTSLDMNTSLAQESSTSAIFSPAARQSEQMTALNKDIAAGDLRLQLLLQQYSEKWPDVKDLKKQLEELRKQRDVLQTQFEKQQAEEAAKPKEAPRKSTNVQMMQVLNNIQSQIEATNALLKNNDTERQLKLADQAKYNKEIESYRNKLSATSNIEAQYADLQRDYANAAQVYNETLRKKEMTSQSSALIQKNATEKLEVLDPPSLPTKPTKPNRWQYAGIGVGLSLMLGLAVAGVQEARDTSLKNLKDVRAYTNLPVLSSIPLLENTILVKRKKRITYLLWSGAIVLGLMAVGASLFYYYTVIANT